MPAIRRRATTKLLRLYPEELADITARAELCGLKPARFIRERALGARPKAGRIPTDCFAPWRTSAESSNMPRTWSVRVGTRSSPNSSQLSSTATARSWPKWWL